MSTKVRLFLKNRKACNWHFFCFLADVKHFDPSFVQCLGIDFPIKNNENVSIEEILSIVEKEIGVLIDSDFEKLLSILYRLDVDEDKFKASLGFHDTPQQIAKLIVERELQKMYFRNTYKNN